MEKQPIIDSIRALTHLLGTLVSTGHSKSEEVNKVLAKLMELTEKL